MIRIIVAAALVAFAIEGIIAQSPSPRFEVSSVRLSDRSVPPSRTMTDGRLALISVPLTEVLMMAFRVVNSHLVAPDWVRDVRVSIQATYPPGAGGEQVSAMLQSLLRERFGLIARFDARPADVYEMVVGADGIKMREVPAVDDLRREFPAEAGANPISDRITAVGYPGPDSERRIIRTPRGTRVITARSSWLYSATERGTLQFEAERMSMPELAGQLSLRADRPVIDKTGLTGVYEFNVELPELAITRRLVQELLGGRNVGGSPIRSEPLGTTAEKAVAPLGLELKKRRSPIDVLVIDQLDRVPTEN